MSEELTNQSGDASERQSRGGKRAQRRCRGGRGQDSSCADEKGVSCQVPSESSSPCSAVTPAASFESPVQPGAGAPDASAKSAAPRGERIYLTSGGSRRGGGDSNRSARSKSEKRRGSQRDSRNTHLNVKRGSKPTAPLAPYAPEFLSFIYEYEDERYRLSWEELEGYVLSLSGVRYDAEALPGGAYVYNNAATGVRAYFRAYVPQEGSLEAGLEFCLEVPRPHCTAYETLPFFRAYLIPAIQQIFQISLHGL